jgi:Holliday junction resolvase
MVNSRAKGARAERDLAQSLKEAMGWTSARRSQQFCGAGQTADLIVREVPQLHLESKMVEALSIHPVMERAVKEAGGTKLAVLCHRKKRTGWLVTMRLEDWQAISQIVASAPRSESDGT